MSLAIVNAMLLAVGLLILSVANGSLLAWSRAAESRFPFDRTDSDDARLAKAGVDIMFGTVPVFVAMVLQVLSVGAPLELSPGQQVAGIAGSFLYLLLYFAFVRRRYGAFRLKIRRILVGSSREG